MKRDVNNVTLFAEHAENHAKNTNRVLGQVKKSNLKLFEVVKEAYLDLKDDKKELAKYKTLVDIDRSTLNKIIKIVENDTLLKFAQKLPASWASLYAMCSMEGDDLVDAITNEKITSKSTLAEISEVRNEYQGKESDSVENNDEDKTSEVSSSTSDDKGFEEYVENSMDVNLDALDLTEKDVIKVTFLLAQLQEFGFVIDGVNVIDRVAA